MLRRFEKFGAILLALSLVCLISILGGASDAAHGDVDDLPDCDVCSLVGDADGSGGIDIDDPVYLIHFIFRNGPAPVCHEVMSGDPTADCQVDIDDVVFLIYHWEGVTDGRFGPAPPSCEEWLAACGGE